MTKASCISSKQKFLPCEVLRWAIIIMLCFAIQTKILIIWAEVIKQEDEMIEFLTRICNKVWKIANNMDKVRNNHSTKEKQCTTALIWSVNKQSGDQSNSEENQIISKITKEWLKRKIIHILVWPSQSLDLNPVEMLMLNLKIAVQNRKPLSTGCFARRCGQKLPRANARDWSVFREVWLM